MEEQETLRDAFELDAYDEVSFQSTSTNETSIGQQLIFLEKKYPYRAVLYLPQDQRPDTGMVGCASFAFHRAIESALALNEKAVLTTAIEPIQNLRTTHYR